MEKGKIEISERIAAVVSDVVVEAGARASVLRRRFKLTLRDVADALGIHEHGVSEMERGKRDVSAEYVSFLIEHEK